MKDIRLLLIDGQCDFCDPKGSLFVTGADKDMDNVAVMINKYGKKINDIHATLDSHQECDIAHPYLWVDAHGKHPGPFTIISKGDVERGIWGPVNPAWRNKFLNYVTTLETNGRYPLCIWPPHCIIGSWGQSLYPSVSDAIRNWQKENTAWCDYVTKGSNPWTEHYSALKADVPDPTDPGTLLNIRLVETLKEADDILIAGEALSHCVKFTVTDICNAFGEENIKKFVLLEDCTSSVTGFEQNGKDFVKDLSARGMRISDSKSFF